VKAPLPLYVLVVLTLLATLTVAVRQGGGIAAPDDGARLAAIERRLDRMEGLVREARDEARRAAAGARRVDVRALPSADAAVSAADTGDGTDTTAAMADDTLEQAVAERVGKQVEAQLERHAAERRNRADDGRWKPPIDDVRLVLDLTPQQEDELRAAFDAARDEAYTLLTTQRADGGNLVDDFAEDLRRSEEPGRAWGRLFSRLASENVPGGSRTYLAVLASSAERIRDQIAGRLTPDQARRFRALNIDVFDVKTGHDPVGDHVRERLEQGRD